MTDVLMPAEARELLPLLTDEERAELEKLLDIDARTVIWRPLPGPQTMAFESTADVIGYGGGAGGGKTDLAIGKSLLQHKRVSYFRVEGTELNAVVDRIEEMIGSRDGYKGSGREHSWAINPPVAARPMKIEFGSVPVAGSERKHRGRPKDLLVIDEAGEFMEQPVRFPMGWVRSTDVKQRCQVLMCFNPPTRQECRWIIEYFAPWLDPAYKGQRAMPGELRWFAMFKGATKEVEVANGEPFTHEGELVIPKSRTFIPALVGDNPFLYGTNYMAQLQALPEPLRSQMLYGDMSAGIKDDAMQVIPSAWVREAMARWSEPHKLEPMDSIGVDVARGGDDRTTLARRHGMWFNMPLVYAGKDTPNGETVMALVVANMRDRAVIHIDVDGVGASPYDLLNTAGFQIVGLKNATSTPGETDESGMLTFSNLRSLLWWRMREALDPRANNGIALPPDEGLAQELCMPRWYLKGKTICVESREELMNPKRLGKSPDVATAYIMALLDTPKLRAVTALQAEAERQQRREYDPLDPRNLR